MKTSILTRFWAAGSKSGHPSIKPPLGWFGQKRVFNHIGSPCTEHFILFWMITVKLWYDNAVFLLNNFLGLKRWQKCNMILELTLIITYANERALQDHLSCSRGYLFCENKLGVAGEIELVQRSVNFNKVTRIQATDPDLGLYHTVSTTTSSMHFYGNLLSAVCWAYPGRKNSRRVIQPTAYS